MIARSLLIKFYLLNKAVWFLRDLHLCQMNHQQYKKKTLRKRETTLYDAALKKTYHKEKYSRDEQKPIPSNENTPEK